MTECNSEQIHFSRVGRQQVVADFNGGRLTSDAGVLLLREIDLLPGRSLCNWRQGSHRSRMIHWRHRRTLCRLENRVNHAALVKMSALFVERFLAAHDVPPKEIVLDFDATNDPVHGQQESRFYQGYYRHYCFLPLYVFCGGHLLCALLRPANIDGAKHSRAVTKLLVERIRLVWPDVKIIIRGNGGFCRWQLMRWCENHAVEDVFGSGRNKILEREVEPLMKQAEAAFAETGQKQRLFGETDYQAGTWDRPRRVTMKAERLAAGPCRRFIVRTLKGPPQSRLT